MSKIGYARVYTALARLC